MHYAGTTVRLKDTKGLHDIARLLAADGTEVAAVDLIGARTPAGARISSLSDKGFGVERDAGDLLDPEAREQYRSRVRELELELEDAAAAHDPIREERARDERDFLLAELRAAVGLQVALGAPLTPRSARARRSPGGFAMRSLAPKARIDPLAIISDGRSAPGLSASTILPSRPGGRSVSRYIPVPDPQGADLAQAAVVVVTREPTGTPVDLCSRRGDGDARRRRRTARGSPDWGSCCSACSPPASDSGDSARRLADGLPPHGGLRTCLFLRPA